MTDSPRRPDLVPLDPSNPWRRLSRRVVYANPWITVEEDEVIRPDGMPGIYGVVRFPGRAIGIAALDDAGRLVLVGQYRYTLGRYSWEIPEGGSGRDEEAVVAARRELAEETGLQASDWQLLLRADLSNSVSDEEAIIFLARGLSAGTPSPDETERLEVRWVSLDEALARVRDGTITDAMSIMAIQRLALEREGA